MRLYLLLSIGIITSFSVFAQQFDEQTTKVSDVRMNVTNIGTFGNAFRGYRDGSGSQSCEYPAGSGVEHMFESGFWFGGLVNSKPARPVA